jgi:hypothetical protein
MRDEDMNSAEQAGEDIHFSFGVDAEPRAGGEWGKYEQSRVRSFLKSEPQPIGDGKLGSVGPVSFELSCKRTAGGFEASYALSLEERIGPNRVDKGQATGRWLSNGGVVTTFPMPQFARACGTRTHQWQGQLTKDQFDAITGFDTIGDVSIRRC